MRYVRKLENIVIPLNEGPRLSSWDLVVDHAVGHQETVVQSTTAMIDGAVAQADDVATQACKENESCLEG